MKTQAEWINSLQADKHELEQRLANAERILRDHNYFPCTAAACNCASYHRDPENVRVKIETQRVDEVGIKFRRFIASWEIDGESFHFISPLVLDKDTPDQVACALEEFAAGIRDSWVNHYMKNKKQLPCK